MKKSILFIVHLSLLAYLFHSNVFAQNNEALPQKTKDDCTPPLGHLDSRIAENRINFFRDNKKDFIEKRYNVKADDISVDKQTMINFLKEIKEGHDGLRIYFALIPESSGYYTKKQFTLIFIPTSHSEDDDEDDNTKKVSNDDEKNIYLVSDGKFISIDKNHPFRNWINKHINRAAPKIESEISRKFSRRYRETHSLWFSKELLFDDEHSLLSFLLKCNLVTEVKIDFASWIIEPGNTQYAYKTDIIFELNIEGNKSIFSTLGAIEIKNNFEEKIAPFIEAEKLNKSGYTDTGLPCPPNQCP